MRLQELAGEDDAGDGADDAGGGGGGGGGKDDSSVTRVVKALRLLRIGRMLRVTKIKRMLEKYSDSLEFQPILQLVMTIFSILLAAHMLACSFYYIGAQQ